MTLRDDLTGKLDMWVVYYSPSDYPGLWVIRRHRVYDGEVMPDPDLWADGESLAEVRKTLPAGLTRTPRHDEDDPVIWELWF